MRLDQFAREMARPLGLKGHQKRTELVPSITMEHELRVESPLEGLGNDSSPYLVTQSLEGCEPVSKLPPFSMLLGLARVGLTRRVAAWSERTADRAQRPVFVVADAPPSRGE